MRPKKLSKTLVLLSASILVSVYLIFYMRIEYPHTRNIWMIQALGYTALGALFLSLLVGSYLKVMSYFGGKIKNKPLAIALRRHLGIVAALFALSHFCWVMSTYLRFNWEILLELSYLRAGLVGLITLVLLLLTSFPFIIKTLKIKYWNELHRLAYVIPLFLMQHLLLSPFALREVSIIISIGFALLLCTRLVPANRFKKFRE